MVALFDKVASALMADGFSVGQGADGLLYGEGRAANGAPRHRWVWVADYPDGMPPDVAARLMTAFDALPASLRALAERRPEPGADDAVEVEVEIAEPSIDAYGLDVAAYLVVPSRRGISGQQASEIRRKGVIRNSPREYFDSFYRAKGSSSYDALKSYAQTHRELISHRVPHRFRHVSPVDFATSASEEGDLFDRLAAGLDGRGSRPRITVVIGGAGAGKSVLYNALYAHLYERFTAYKRNRKLGGAPVESAARPLFFLPESIRHNRGYSLDSLLDAFFETIGAASVSTGLFNWLHQQGHVIPMLDGMDEFFARQSDLFDQLSANIDAPGSTAQLILCVRDSVLSTNPVFADFVRRHASGASGSDIALYALEPWGPEARRELAWLRIEGRLPDHPADTPQVAGFLGQIEASPGIRSLAQLPFYCDLLVDIFVEPALFEAIFGDHTAQRFGETLPDSDLEVLEVAVQMMLHREHIKLVGREQEDEVPAAYMPDARDEADFPLDDLVRPDQHRQMIAPQANLTVTDDRSLELFQLFGEIRTELGKEGLLRLLEQVAHVHRRKADLTPGQRGITMDELQGVLDRHRGGEPLPGDRAFRAMLILRQAAFFVGTPGGQTIDFAHELIADYLAAGHALEILRSDPGDIGAALGDRPIDAHSVFARRLMREIERDDTLPRDLLQTLATVVRG